MSKYLAFDIETIPDRSKIFQLPPVEIKTGNIKDPEKIKAKEDQARAEQVERMALDPLFGRICCAVFYDGDKTTKLVMEKASDDAERALLESITEILFKTDKILVTWNGNGFDLPFLYKRMMIFGMWANQTLAYWTKRYDTSKHIDLMQVWSNWNSQNYAKLDTVSCFVSNETKLDIDVKTFPELLETKEGKEKLLEYCEQDVILTHKLARRFEGYLF